MIIVYTTNKIAELLLMKAINRIGASELDLTMHEMGCGTVLEFGNWTSFVAVANLVPEVDSLKELK